MNLGDTKVQLQSIEIDEIHDLLSGNDISAGADRTQANDSGQRRDERRFLEARVRERKIGLRSAQSGAVVRGPERAATAENSGGSKTFKGSWMACSASSLSKFGKRSRTGQSGLVKVRAKFWNTDFLGGFGEREESENAQARESEAFRQFL